MGGPGSITPVDQAQEWEFFCECGRYGCDKRVKLTVAACRALHDGGGAVLAPGHQPSERLQAQAELQAQRARKNLRRTRT